MKCERFRQRSRGNALVCFLFIASLVFPVRAQVSSGSLIGDVRDEKSANVAGVVIQARNNETGFSRTVTTNEFGSYRIDDLLPGAYTVTAEHDGFQGVTVSPVFVELNQKARLDVDVRVGSTHERVTVNAHTSPLQTDEASEGYLLGSHFIEELPLLGRNIISLVTLGPGAIPRQLGGFTHDIMNDLQGNRGAVAFNAPVNGARSTANSYILDGAYNSDQNVFSIAVVPPIETVEEFRIQTSLAPAEFAQSGGAVVDIVTKPGSQQLHGNAFEFFRNEATDAKGFFDVPGLPRGIFRQNQYGATLGGPIASNTYFFASYEGLRSRSANSTQHLVPDATVRSGNFSGFAPIFDPSTLNAGSRQPFLNNVIPARRIDPAAAKYLAIFEPLPNYPLTNGSNYVDSTPNRDHADNGSIRLDRAWGDFSRLFARYTINDDRTLLAGSFPALPTSEQLRAQQIALGHTFAGPAWVNETHLSFTRLRVFDLPVSAFGTNVLANLGIHGLANDPFTYGLPALTVTDYETVQDSQNLPQTQRDNTWYLASSFSRTMGRHTWKTGFQLTHFTMAYLQSLFARGNFIFNGTYTQDPSNPGTTGDAFADFLLGFPAQTQRAVGSSQAYLRHNSYGAYAQDDWRITPRISISAGLRYEYVAPFSEDRGNLLNLDYSTLPSAPVLRPVSAGTQSNRLDFAPRIGLAARLPHLFSSSRDTVFRAGYGIFFSPEIAVETYDLLRNGIRNEFNEPGGLLPVLTLENGFPQTSSTGFPSYFGVDRNAPTPYVQQWSSSIQRELPGNTLLEMAYIGTKGTGLGLFRRFNTPAHVEIGQDLPPRAGDLQTLRTFPELGTIYQRQHIGNSIYHSLQIKAEKRFTGGLSFLASFVWAKSIDDTDNIVPGSFESFGAQDERNLRLERGLSFFDVRRRLSAGYVYTVPTATVLRPLLRNWQVSGNLTFQDGTPLNPVYYATDFANSGTPNRPNVVPGQSVNLPASQRSADRFFNVNAFSDPAPFTFGDAGRDILPGPGNAVVDLALHRRFAIREKKTVEFRVETFNLLNHPNFGIPGPYPDFGPFFGKAFSAGDPRRMQFALRFDF